LNARISAPPEAADALQKVIDDILARPEHQWLGGK
jgi:hypothetical protein